jgi:hypothetical protein
MSSVSPASELFSDSSDSATTDLAERQGELPVYLRQALNMLDLQPEVEIAKYRSYKAAKLNNTQTYEQLNSVITAPEEEEEDYEEIPPSEPFAVMEHARTRSSNTEPPGELVFKDVEPPAASLDLSLLPPGEISSARNEYAPASQELWRSLGKPAPLAAAKVPGWKMPVAIGSSLTAIAAVAGMTYVNMHPLLLQQVPVVSQLTAPPVLPAIPPGQNLQGPDLAMGEFSDLSLGNLNSITIPGSAAPLAQNPVSPSPSSTTAVAPVTSVLTSPILTPNTTPNTTVAPVTAQPTNGSRLADTLIRNLLPPNIQQMAGSDAQSQVVTPQAPAVNQAPVTTQPSTTVKPYVPQSPATPPKSSKKISDTTGNAAQYQVMTKYVNPIGLERIQAILPTATRAGDRINLGSFSQKSAADTLVTRLKEQGISAWRKQG